VRAFCRRRLQQQRDRFAEQLPDSLQILASALRAGHSFSGALAVVAADSEQPTQQEFQRVAADEQVGLPVEDSLRDVARRMDSSDLDQVALVAELQRQSGGNMAEVLDRVIETIRGRFELRRLVRTLTAQGRMARWIVSMLPVFLFAVIWMLNPAYERVLYQSSGGKFALALAGMMILAGSYAIKRIVNIKV
jgi:tight adherence protein B